MGLTSVNILDLQKTWSGEMSKLASRIAYLYMSKTSSKETWRVKNTVRSQDNTLDEIDVECVRAGLKCYPHVEGNHRQITVEGDPSVIEKVMSLPYVKFKVEKVANTKTAASGNYGFTKRTQNDVEVALRKLEKKVNQLARAIESKYPEAGSYFSQRCQGSTCNASKALSKKCLLNLPPKKVKSGPLGYSPSCAKSAHKAISDLILFSGEVAHSLYNKDRDHALYLQTHAKRKRCPLTKMLLENYPVEIM